MLKKIGKQKTLSLQLKLVKLKTSTCYYRITYRTTHFLFMVHRVQL